MFTSETNLALVIQPFENWRQNIEKNSVDENMSFWATTLNTCLTSNWGSGQTIKPKPMKFVHKKRQIWYYKRKIVWNHWLGAFRYIIFLFFPLWDLIPCNFVV